MLQTKTRLLEEVSNRILYEEIPNKQKFYVERKLEPVIKELEIDVLSHKQTLQEKLKRSKVPDFDQVFAQEKLLDKNVDDFIKRLGNV